MAAQVSDFNYDSNERKRLRCLLDSYAGDNLNRDILSYSQRYDPQTRLLNHHSFQEALSARLGSLPAGQELALIWIDLVSLRRESSLWGWKRAEELARRIAGNLRFVADDNALLGRAGDSSFVVAMEASKRNKANWRRIQAVVDALMPQGQSLSETRLAVSAGVAFFPSDTDSVEDLTRFAILAADRASCAKSRNLIAFRPRMNTTILRDHLLEVEMRKGLNQSQFRIYYQPKVDLITGKVLAVESLMRWNHPELGEIAPSEFIPVAERTDLIHRVFEFNLRKALEDARRWRNLGLPLPVIAVNASVASVREDDFARTVRTIMAEIPIAPTRLELEVTESLAFDNEELFRARVRQLKAIGVRVAIDDFGTRYTGFNVLKKLRLDTIKIDQCFIHGVGRCQDMLSLCRTIVAMGRQLKMRTVAEGIEERGELEAMRQIGCEAGQGFLFQRPVEAEDFTSFLRDWPELKRAFAFVDERSLFEADALCAAG